MGDAPDDLSAAAGGDEPQSAAARLLRDHGDLRDRALRHPSYRQFRSGYRELQVDDERLYVRAGAPMSSGGDTLLDEDELLLAWARAQPAKDAAPEAEKIRRVFDSAP